MLNLYVQIIYRSICLIQRASDPAAIKAKSALTVVIRSTINWTTGSRGFPRCYAAVLLRRGA